MCTKNKWWDSFVVKEMGKEEKSVYVDYESVESISVNKHLEFCFKKENKCLKFIYKIVEI